VSSSFDPSIPTGWQELPSPDEQACELQQGVEQKLSTVPITQSSLEHVEGSLHVAPGGSLPVLVRQ
jgi:hypothetical protein